MSHSRLRDVFRNVLDIDPSVSDDQLMYGKTPGWDSLAHMQLVGELEEEFDVMLEADDVVGMSSFAEAKKILGRHGVDVDG